MVIYYAPDTSTN